MSDLTTTPPRPAWKRALLIAAATPIFVWFSPSGTAEKLNQPHSVDWQGTALPNPADFFQFTPPIELSRLANEWEPQQALLLSLFFPQAMENLEIARNFVNLLDAAHPYLEIYVFCEQEKHREYANFLSLIVHHPNVESIMERTHFVDSRSLMRWIRDFGPVFGFGMKGQLVAIDYLYRDPMKALEEKALKIDEPLDPLRDFFMLHGDALSADVAALLQTEFDVPVDIVRPPVSMDGGDFLSDGQGNVFVSRQTLVRNGGDRAKLEQAFRQYFGAKRLHVLEALPGRTVPHLDMIVKFLDHETILVPNFQASAEEAINPYLAELNRATRSVIEKNETYLRSHFPGHRFLKVPMPPILFKSRDEIVAEAKQAFVKALAVDRGLATAEEIAQYSEAQLADLEDKALTGIKRELPSADLSSDEGLDSVLRHYRQLPLDSYIARYSEPGTRYRSYINSTFLHNSEGQQAFLVPQFTSTDARESSRLKEWESSVENAYKTAWPEADIKWINCDAMVSELGFLHCATLTVPLLGKN